MLICHCKALSERSIRACILAGARDRAAVAERCGAGADCGGCLVAIDELLAEVARRNESSDSAMRVAFPA